MKLAKFKLDKTLGKDCIEICNLRLSKLLLMNDSRFLWCILVPMQQGLTELYQLSKIDNSLLNNEMLGDEIIINTWTGNNII